MSQLTGSSTTMGRGSGDAKDTKAPTGSTEPPEPSADESRSLCAAYQSSILEKLGQGLTAQRIFQDLRDEQGLPRERFANSIKYSKRGKKGRRRGRARTMQAAARHTANGAVTVEQLIEVKKLADSLGGAHQVRLALDSLDMLR